MMYQGDIFWVEQLIAYCIAAILWCIIDKINSRKHIKDTEELPPIHITQTNGDFGHYFPAIKLVGDGSSGLVFSIDATTAQQQTGDS